MINLTRLSELPQVIWASQESIASRMIKLEEECEELIQESHFLIADNLLLREFADVCIVMASIMAKKAFTEDQLLEAFHEKLLKLDRISKGAQF
jgi:hypothetical protein